MIKKRVVAFDLLKVFSCIAVILIHLSAIILDNRGVHTIYFKTANIYASIAHFAVPVFIMISGAFLLSKNKELSIKEVYKKYFFRIGIIYILMGIFYKIFNFYIDGMHNLTLVNIFNMFLQVLFGNCEIFLWYLYMMIGIYMLYPIIYKIKVLDRKYFRYLLIVLFILSCFTWSFNEFSSFFGMNVRFYNQFNFSIYIFYFLLGYYLYNYKLSRMVEIIFIMLIPVMSFLTVYLSNAYCLKLRTFNLNFVNYYSINIVILSIGIFCLFKVIMRKVKFGNNSTKIINVLSSATLPIYLWHMLVIDLIKKYNFIHFTKFINVVLLPVYSLFIFIFWLFFYFFVKMVCKVFKSVLK